MATVHTITLGNGSGIIIALDAATKVTETFRGRATQIPTANRSATTDHYIRENASFSLEGVISGVFNPKPSGLTPPSDISGHLRSTIEAPQLVKFISGDNKAYENCFMENVTLKRTVLEGVNGWSVSCSLTQVQISEGGVDSVVSVTPATTDSAQGIVDTGGSTTESVDVVNISIWDSLGHAFIPKTSEP